MEMEMEMLTSGASNRIIPLFKTLKTFILFLLSLVLPLRHRGSKLRRRDLDLEDTRRRRSLAEALHVEIPSSCRSNTFLFYGCQRNALFCRSWIPIPNSNSNSIRGILIIIHGLNEHRYVHFARKLTSCQFAVYAMDWIGHGGSDGLHGYVPSLDYVVADVGAFLEKVKSDNPGIPCFLFGHSTGGAVVLKAASYAHTEELLEGVILTSPALRVKPAHPIIGVVAPLFSLLVH